MRAKRVWIPPSLPLHLSRSCAVLAPPRPRPRPRRALPPPPFRPSQKGRKKKRRPVRGAEVARGVSGRQRRGLRGSPAGQGAGGAWGSREGPEVWLGCGPGRPVLCRGRGRSVGGARGALGPSPAKCLPGPVGVPRQSGRAFVLENEALLGCSPSCSSQDEGKAQFNALGVIFLVIQGNTHRDLRGD